VPGHSFRKRAQQHERDWFKVLFQLQGSVIPAVMPRVIICSAFALLIAVLHVAGLRVSLPVLGGLVPSIVLGLLLVFRTNTAYERFWEGRILWGTVVNTVRNLARQIWVAIAETTPEDKAAKVRTIRLLAAFAVAMKLHLRDAPPNHELNRLVTPEQFAKLQTMNNPPLEVAFWIADYLQSQRELNKLNTYQLTSCLNSLDSLVDAMGGCERVLKTPIPLAYSIHLKQLLMLYCLALPFQMVGALGWATPTVVALISFAVFGIEEIGIEIENPFGHDPNDLPLDAICHTMQQNLEDLISLSPNVAAQLREPREPSLRT
jgi:putative membrane protein